LETQLSIVSGLPPRTLSVSQTSIIGRAAEADLVLVHPEISRRHCRLVRDGDNWFIEDLGSQRGTLVNQVKIAGRTELKSGDRITLGPVTLGFGVQASADALTEQTEGGRGRMRVHGKLANAILLNQQPIVIGRSDEADVQLTDVAISRQHARIERGPNGFRITDLHSKAGSFVNGRRFDAHDLVIGDQVQVGPFCFVFDGRQLVRTYRLSVGRIVAQNLVVKRGRQGRPILKEVSFVAEPGQFIGILGPSGAGKTTLLNALSGLRPADSGQILVDGADYYDHLHELRALFGYVPQDDIVHRELAVREALTFAARLRLPAGTPRSEIRTLVEHTLQNLGLADRSNLPIEQLSGGQRKRASVAVELLSRPPLLFLDEPTSGLDPLSEFKLMELLRGLADTGCTVVCTTHVMENVYLMDQIAILVDGRIVFQGTPEATRERFGVARLSNLYDTLQNLDASAIPPFEPAPAKTEPTEPRTLPKAIRRAFSLPILLERQAAIFRADFKNLLIVLGQPLVIGALVAWVSQSAPLTQFFAYIATLWFGCSNSAQEIVRELPIYRRERLVGLSRWSYLLAKFLWMGGLTSLQVILLFLVLALAGKVSGLWPLQLGSLIVIAFAATGIGLTLSTLAKSPLQAVMLVPIILIPQILFSGFAVETNEMPESVLAVSRVFPSFAAQRIADSSFILKQTISGELLRNYKVPYDNMNQWYRSKYHARLNTGKVLTDATPAYLGFLNLALWTLGGFTASYALLARKERSG
jgi:ABC-type multidrug transport system ATPase subunit/pSer/pThr/pTyr-binding forkhead associated (FHA) protein/ABC-type multidrug transport system permease subunit